MKIAVVVHALHKGGAEAVTRAWIGILADAGHDVHVYTYGDDEEAVGSGAPDPRYRRRIFVSSGSADKWRRLPGWIGRCLDSDDIDLVIAVLEFSNIMTLLATRRRRLPVIIVEHGIPTLLWDLNGRSGKVKRALATRLYPRADAVVAVSHVVATDLRGSLGVRPDRLHVISNLVEVRRFADARPRAAAVPNGDDGSLRILLVGRMAREKNFGAALEAAAELTRSGRPTSVAVIGRGPEEEALADLARHLGVQVDFLGWQATWATAAAPGDVLVVTSSSEAFGNVLVEAAAAGIAAVAPSSALGVAEAMIPGVTGVLARSSTPSDLAAAVLAARDLDPSTCPSAWLDRFTVEAVGPAVLSLVEGLQDPSRTHGSGRTTMAVAG